MVVNFDGRRSTDGDVGPDAQAAAALESGDGFGSLLGAKSTTASNGGDGFNSQPAQGRQSVRTLNAGTSLLPTASEQGAENGAGIAAVVRQSMGIG